MYRIYPVSPNESIHCPRHGAHPGRQAYLPIGCTQQNEGIAASHRQTKSSPTATLLSYYFQNFLFFRHGTNSALPRRDQSCRCICKGHHLTQLLFCQILYAMLQQVVQ